MNWHYADQGQRKGPIGETELDELVAAGTLPNSTLIWCEGMPEWAPYVNVRVTRAAVGGCLCCGRYLLPGQSVDVAGNAICADCKPVYIERLREGDLPAAPGALPYSGFWMRFVARAADYTLLTIVEALLIGTVMLWILRRSSVNSSGSMQFVGYTTLLGLLLSGVYEIVMLSRRGATVGKFLCHMRVVNADGSTIRTGTAIGRFFAGLVSRLTLGIGYAMAAFDGEKRTLHDRMAGTRVIDMLPPDRQRRDFVAVERGLRCGLCQTAVAPTEWNVPGLLPCPGCNAPVQAIVFPAITRTLFAVTPQPKEAEEEAVCFHHSTNRATAACEGCGRFVCGLCDFDAGPRHLCPICFQSSAGSPEFVARRTLYDSIALTAAIAPFLLILTAYLTFFTAPAVVGFSIWTWNKPGTITPRSRWRFTVAMLIAGLNILFIAAVIATIMLRVVR